MVVIRRSGSSPIQSTMKTFMRLGSWPTKPSPDTELKNNTSTDNDLKMHSKHPMKEQSNAKMHLWHGRSPTLTLLPKNPQLTLLNPRAGDDNFRNSIPRLETNHPQKIHPPHSLNLLRPVGPVHINAAQTFLLPTACLRLLTQHTNPPRTQTKKKATKQHPGSPRVPTPKTG